MVWSNEVLCFCHSLLSAETDFYQWQLNLNQNDGSIITKRLQAITTNFSRNSNISIQYKTHTNRAALWYSLSRLPEISFSATGEVFLVKVISIMILSTRYLIQYYVTAGVCFGNLKNEESKFVIGNIEFYYIECNWKYRILPLHEVAR